MADGLDRPASINEKPAQYRTVTELVPDCYRTVTGLLPDWAGHSSLNERKPRCHVTESINSAKAGSFRTAHLQHHARKKWFTRAHLHSHTNFIQLSF
jgi:hypothetical protein